MTLTVELDDEEQNRLDLIVAATQSSTQSDAVRALINEKYQALQTELTLTQRRGGHPQHLMNDAGNQSERKSRKKAVDSILAARAARRAQ